MQKTVFFGAGFVTGLIAVMALGLLVWRCPAEKCATRCEVVSFSRNLKAGDVVAEDDIALRSVSVDSLPRQHIAWAERSSVLGQRLSAAVAKGDYVLWSQLAVSSSLGDAIGRGEWGVPVSFSGGTLLPVLQAGDEIAIVGVFSSEAFEKAGAVAGEGARRCLSAVLYPRVRILAKSGDSTVILSLPPQQAVVLASAQRQCELFPVLRRANDNLALSREECGFFDGETLLEELMNFEKIKVIGVAK